jgi:hypothetical protein
MLTSNRAHTHQAALSHYWASLMCCRLQLQLDNVLPAAHPLQYLELKIFQVAQKSRAGRHCQQNLFLIKYTHRFIFRLSWPKRNGMHVNISRKIKPSRRVLFSVVGKASFACCSWCFLSAKKSLRIHSFFVTWHIRFAWELSDCMKIVDTSSAPSLQWFYFLSRL